MTGEGARISTSWPPWFFGKAVTSRIVSAVRQQHHQPVDAERDAAVGRRAILERFEHVPELLRNLLVVEAEQLEDACAASPAR